MQIPIIEINAFISYNKKQGFETDLVLQTIQINYNLCPFQKI